MTVLLREPGDERCRSILETADRLVISAATFAEAMIVAARKGVELEMAELFDNFGIEVIDVTRASARRVFAAYRQWGKGYHPAALNFGDCFSYEAAMTLGCPLLFVGGDFAKTDVESAT
jgi:ribonuclease VapC